MLLVDQVDVLRENLPLLRNQRFSLPMMGGQHPTRQAYKFKYLVHPARDIATTITQADPRGDKLPAHLRGWDLQGKDWWGKSSTISLKFLLGMIIHGYYVHLDATRLDVINDWGERFIVYYATFLEMVERLVFSPKDGCLVICSLIEEKLKTKNDTKLDSVSVNTPGYGDLIHLLATIEEWPELGDILWQTFFARQSRTIERSSQTVNNRPGLMANGYLRSQTIISWKLGWRRDELYAESCIDLLSLIDVIRSYHNR